MERIFHNSNLDHIGIIVQDIKVSREKFSKLFGQPVFTEDFVPQKIILDKYKLNNCMLEVFQPYLDNEHLQKFLLKYGEGIHHICINNIQDNQVQQLITNNYQLIYPDWQVGSGKSQINFIHPSGLCGVLLELKKSQNII